MKILFVIKASKIFSYHQSTVKALCERGHHVHLLFPMKEAHSLDEHGLKEAVEEAKGRLTLERGLGRKRNLTTKIIHNTRELRSFASYLKRPDQSRYYLERWFGYLDSGWQKAVKIPGVRTVLAKKTGDKLLQKLENLFPVDPEILKRVQELKPDVVIASPVNMKHSEEVEYLKAAKQLGIPTAISVLSWDNLTTKGLFHISPDRLLVWNESHAEQARSIHGVSRKKIRIIGSPFFDKWWDTKITTTAKSFFEKVGLDPTRPYLLYLGSSSSISPNEWWLIEQLKGELDKQGMPMQILVRPHPGNASSYGKTPPEEILVWPREGALPDSKQAFEDFHHSVLGSVATVGLNTSGMLDAIILDKPCYSILPEETRITQEATTHFKELLRSQAIYTALNAAECVGQILKNLREGTDPLAPKRKAFVQKFIRPQSNSAGYEAALAIEELKPRPKAKNSFARVTQRMSELRVKPLPKNQGQRVLLASGLGGYNNGMVTDTVLALALSQRGAEIDFLLCDSFLPACQQMKLGNTPTHLLRDGERSSRCSACEKKGSHLLEAAGISPLKYSELVDRETRERIRAEVAVWPLEDLATYAPEGIPVGEHALAGTLRYFARGDFSTEPEGEAVLRRYLEAALLTARAMDTLFKRSRYDVVVAHHGIYVPQGIVVALAKKHKVRVVTWNPAYRKHCFIFSHDDSYHHTMVNEPVEAWKGLSLDEDLDQGLQKYLKSRWHGTEDWIWFHSEPQHDVSAIAKEVGFDRSKPVVTLLSNVVWDAQLHYPSNAFKDMRSWVLETIEHFSKRPELQLVIRIHPAEIRGFVPSRQPLAPEIDRAFPVLPSNVFIVPPHSDVSTYALCEASNAVLIYNTKTGIEVAAQGIPTIVAGEAWVRNKGFAPSPTTREQYFEILNQLPFKERMTADAVKNARKYAYHIFFRRMLPLPFLKTESANALTLELDSLSELAPGKFPGLDVICNGILAGDPFILAAERKPKALGSEKTIEREIGLSFQ